jgi:hypothetical protein
MRDQMTSQNFISQKREGCTKIRKLIPLAFISIRLMSPSRGAVGPSAPSSSSQRSLETFAEPEMPTGRQLSKGSRTVGTFAASRFATIVLRAVFSESRVSNLVVFLCGTVLLASCAFGTRIALHLSPGENDEPD